MPDEMNDIDIAIQARALKRMCELADTMHLPEDVAAMFPSWEEYERFVKEVTT